MNIKDIAFTCYPVSNLGKSRDFYERVLGLKATSVFAGKDPGFGFVEYDLGNATFAIGAGAEHMKPSTLGATVAFEVDNFETMIKHLKENKINFFLEPSETPVCHMAIITDPDGTKIIIHRRK